MQWFRFYNEVLNDPKVQCLPGETFKAWVNLLCLASQNDGKIPPIKDVTFALRLPSQAVTEHFEILIAAGLIDDKNGSKTPHNWKKRQFKSDTSSERTKRYRDRHKKRVCDVTVTPPEQIQSRTDTEQKTEQIIDGSLGQFAVGLVNGFKKEDWDGLGFEGSVIKLDRRTMGDLYRKHWPRSPQEFRKWITDRDGWYAKQPPGTQKNWIKATVKRLQEMGK